MAEAQEARREAKLDALANVNAALGTKLGMGDFRQIGEQLGRSESVPQLFEEPSTSHPPDSTEFEVLRRYHRSLGRTSFPDARQAARIKRTLLECAEMARGHIEDLEARIREKLSLAIQGDSRRASRSWNDVELARARVYAAEWASDVFRGLMGDLPEQAERRTEQFKSAYGLDSSRPEPASSSGNVERVYRSDFATELFAYLTGPTKPRDMRQREVLEVIANLWIVTDLRTTTDLMGQIDQLVREVCQALLMRAPRKPNQPGTKQE
jgi:hypothetical protein